MSWSTSSCRLCDSTHRVTAHHVTPKEMEAHGYSYEGTIHLCRLCHDMLHEETTVEQLAAGGPTFLTRWLRSARARVEKYKMDRKNRAARRKGGALYNAQHEFQNAVPKWKKKGRRKVKNAIDKSRLLWSMGKAFSS